MGADEAIRSAMEVLEEEETRPTVDYTDTGVGAPTTPSQLGRTEPERMNLYTQRGETLRHVFEEPKRYKFNSNNFELLAAIFGQLEATQRADFVDVQVELIPTGASKSVEDRCFPTWSGQMSYLPLILEFV